MLKNIPKPLKKFGKYKSQVTDFEFLDNKLYTVHNNGELIIRLYK